MCCAFVFQIAVDQSVPAVPNSRGVPRCAKGQRRGELSGRSRPDFKLFLKKPVPRNHESEYKRVRVPRNRARPTIDAVSGDRRIPLLSLQREILIPALRTSTLRTRPSNWKRQAVRRSTGRRLPVDAGTGPSTLGRQKPVLHTEDGIVVPGLVYENPTFPLDRALIVR